MKQFKGLCYSSQLPTFDVCDSMQIWPGLFLLLLTACQAFTPYQDPQQHHLADKQSASGEHWTRYNNGTVSLKVVVPDGWETYNTAAGIVLNEHMGSSAPDSPLRGFLIHIFVPGDENFDMAPVEDVNLAWFVLNQVVTNPDYVGSALVSPPVAFNWDHYEAAYYLLNNRDSTVTMLLALALPTGDNLVVCHVSAPENQTERIRQLLPDLLASLTVDGQPVRPDALRDLPDPLEFPKESD